MKTGMRFNVIVASVTVGNNGQSIKFEDTIAYAVNVPQSDLRLCVHQAKINYPQDKIYVEPTRLYTVEDYLDND